jgi:hypothetical protein
MLGGIKGAGKNGAQNLAKSNRRNFGNKIWL